MEAEQLAFAIDCVERQKAVVDQEAKRLNDDLRTLRDRQGRYQAGAAGEERVGRMLLAMADTGWTTLPDRHWPRTRRANIDVLLVGPGGVFVVDVKNWRAAAVSDGHLWRGQVMADEDVQKVRDQAAAVREILVDIGLAPGAVVPMLVLAGNRQGPVSLGEVTVVGDGQLRHSLLRHGDRLTAGQAAQICRELDTRCPPAVSENSGGYPSIPRPRSRSSPGATDDRAGGAPARGDASGRGNSTGLRYGDELSLDELWAELWQIAAGEPIETWMTWLHPTQSRLTTRHFAGPARIRGPAGTGKTVVALHRAKYLADRGHRVLFTSYVRSLSTVFSSLFDRLAPDSGRCVDFRSIYQVAVAALKQAGIEPGIDERAVSRCWSLAWASAHHDGVLDSLGQSQTYWRDEIVRVIKGRGITSHGQYAGLTRLGRRVALQPVHRRAVWQLYQEYELRRRDAGVRDWADVMSDALRVVRAGQACFDFDSVIVDEVQDLTCTGLQFLHALVGDRPNGLLLVGDGQQSVYPGGFTLSEAGIVVAGRAAVLDHNYRNREQVIRHALGRLPEGSDVEGPAIVSTPTRCGGEVVEVDVPDAAALDSALLARVAELLDRHGARLGDIGILVHSNAAGKRWLTQLRRAGRAAIQLRAYDGRPVDAIKIGTYEHAKGLEFAHVLIPDHRRAPQRQCESDDAYAERHRRDSARLYVAMTRARDSVWLAAFGPGGSTRG